MVLSLSNPRNSKHQSSFKSQHSAGGICITLWASAVEKPRLQAVCYGLKEGLSLSEDEFVASWKICLNAPERGAYTFRLHFVLDSVIGYSIPASTAWEAPVG